MDQQQPSENPAPKKPRGKPFTGASDPRRFKGKETELLPDPLPADQERSLFEDMRHVRRFPKSADRTEGQKDARKWKNRDLKSFMMAYAALEKVQVQQGATGRTLDEGTDRVLELIDKLLTEAGCGQVD